MFSTFFVLWGFAVVPQSGCRGDPDAACPGGAGLAGAAAGYPGGNDCRRGADLPDAARRRSGAGRCLDRDGWQHQP